MNRLGTSRKSSDGQASSLAALSEDGINAIGQPLDITDAPSVFDLAKRAAAKGELGALIYTAGVSPTIGDSARAAASPALTTLVEDPLAANFVDHICALDETFRTPAGAYAGSKYGVLLMALRESVIWGAVGGRVVSLSPGIIDTGMGKQKLENQPFMKAMVEMTPLQRMGNADEIAKLVTFLCSDAASFVTGTDLLVDVGSTGQVQKRMTNAGLNHQA